ncbi:MAG: N-formylglutamate amidohydrolase [Asticcacaulis sp.]|uniref:N-formylglutamate amidohydrolase n=1 Tax=Asticcacaulis sp. TaxID=1872648 RepID=UPI0039E726EB
MSDIVLLCEHASNHIPARYDGLGLSQDDLCRHIAWDLGAAALTRRLSDALDAPAYLGTYSRLLIDLNRPIDAVSSIVDFSEDTPVPGNLVIDSAERAHRIDRIFQPFHMAISALLDKRQRQCKPVRLVSIHSFTPVYLGVVRPWEAGVLFGSAERFGSQLLSQLALSGRIVGANVPYRTSREEDFAVPVHGDDRGIPAVLLEVRNDLINDSANVGQISEWIFAALRASL